MWAQGKLVGPKSLLRYVDGLVADKVPVSFDFWAPVRASLDSEWDAYITIGNAYTAVFNDKPFVPSPPDNPAGYEPEGPVVGD